MALAISNTNIGTGDGSARLVTYTGLSEADTSPSPLEWVEWADKSVQISGTFNGGTCVIEGSNDGTSWFTLTDAQTSAISKTAAALEQVVEVTRYVRPRVSAGTGVSLSVHFVLRRASGLRV